MKPIKVIVKRVGADPIEETICDDLETFQETVGGHTDMTVISILERGRIVMLSNEDAFNSESQLPVNFVLPEKKTVRGDVVFVVRRWSGGNESLLRKESNQLISNLQEISVAAPDPTPEKDPPLPYLSEMHQVLIIPTDQPDEKNGGILTAEEVIAGIAKQIGYSYELVPLTDNKVYGTAIACLEAQGHEFSVTSEDTMTLSMAAQDGGTVDRFVRVVEITALDDVSPD